MTGSDLTLLEDQAVKAATSKQYRMELDSFKRFAQARGVTMESGTDREVDALLVAWHISTRCI